MGEEVWPTLVTEFSDLPDASSLIFITASIAIAAVLGEFLVACEPGVGRPATFNLARRIWLREPREGHDAAQPAITRILETASYSRGTDDSRDHPQIF